MCSCVPCAGMCRCVHEQLCCEQTCPCADVCHVQLCAVCKCVRVQLYAACRRVPCAGKTSTRPSCPPSRPVSPPRTREAHRMAGRHTAARARLVGLTCSGRAGSDLRRTLLPGAQGWPSRRLSGEHSPGPRTFWSQPPAPAPPSRTEALLGGAPGAPCCPVWPPRPPHDGAPDRASGDGQRGLGPCPCVSLLPAPEGNEAAAPTHRRPGLPGPRPGLLKPPRVFHRVPRLLALCKRRG